jgi:prepilin-type processing-associated H-X9-DG protein
MKNSEHDNKSAFTLVEVLVSIGIILLLSTLLVTSSSTVIEAGRRAGCASNLRQIGALFATYAADNQGQLPESGANGLYSLVGQLMPELTYNSPKHPFICPSDKSRGKVSYSIVENTVANPAAYVRRPRPSGDTSSAYLVGLYRMPAFPRPSKTFLMVEAPNVARTYLMSGNYSIVTPQLQFQTGGTYVHAKKGANYLFLDGHVEYIPTALKADLAWPSKRTDTYQQWSDGFSAQ